MSPELQLFDDAATLFDGAEPPRLLTFELYGGLFQHDFSSEAKLYAFLEQLLEVREFAEDRRQAQNALLALEPDRPWSFRHDRIYNFLRADPQTELDLLAATLTPVPHALAALNHALKTGVPAVAACDGPLPEAFWRALMERHGVAGVEAIYTSCESGVSKQKYTMFRRILADRELQPSDVAHFGPDEYNDVGVPRDIGMRYARLAPVAEGLASRSPVFAAARETLGAIGTVEADLLQRAMERALIAACADGDPALRLSQSAPAICGLGPLLVGFSEWIAAWLGHWGCARLFMAAPEQSIFARVGALLVRRDLPELEVIVIPEERVGDSAMLRRDADGAPAGVVSVDPHGAGAGRLVARNPHLALRPALHFALSGASRNIARDQCYLHANGAPTDRARVAAQAAALIEPLFAATVEPQARDFADIGRFAVEWSRLRSAYRKMHLPRATAVKLLAAVAGATQA
ncbi:MAG: HAD family hydrolase [Methylobacteriaceae bacterium]|nr:HAD family hydrolase [Methylobacteriaceae bacterium]